MIGAAMGYIDSDTHVIENEHTWDFFEPGEEQFRPLMSRGYWTIQDLFMEWPAPGMSHWMRDVFPLGSVALEDPKARVRYMDQLGVDVQVLFPTFWLLCEVASPAVEAAMSRSYNRWLAEATADSAGRLAWAVHAPVRTMERAVEELEFGREHGAVSVFLLGQNHGMSIADPSMFPLYEKAQDLDLAISVHVGGDLRASRRQPGNFLHSGIMPVPGAFYAALKGGLAKRFPRLRWAFLEAGASWLPFVLQETFRADETGALRSFKAWRPAAIEAFEQQQLFVAAQMDDDLPYLLDFTGPDHLVHGSDFGHLDVGSDPNGLHIVASRPDLDAEIARKIVDANGRRLYRIDPAFRPAPPPSTEGPVLAPRAAAR
jgi:predicted TIM-barrel fold metal-dependent hydrolase